MRMNTIFRVIKAARNGMAAAVVLCASAQVHAYDDQWKWTVEGHSEEFSSKQAAENFMHGLSPAHSKLTTQETLTQSGTSKSFLYTAPMVSPTPSPWEYNAGGQW